MPTEDVVVLTSYYVKCHATEEQIITEIHTVINHESLHREISKLEISKGESIDNITFMLEELLGWTHVTIAKKEALK